MIWSGLKNKLHKLISKYSQRFNCFFISFSNSSFNFLILCKLRLLRCCLIIFENFCHAVFIATFIINKNEACLTFSADVSKHIVAASMNINIALTFKEMIMRNTFQAWFFIWGIFGACSNVLFVCRCSLGEHLGLLADD